MIVNYRSYEELSRCLSSLEPLRSDFATVTVVDQESDSASAAAVARAFPWALILERRTNDGFATGINAGAASGHAPFLLLLNPDCVAGTDFVARLVDFAVDAPRGRHRRAAHPECRRHDSGIGAPLSRLEHLHRRPELLADEEVSQ